MIRHLSPTAFFLALAASAFGAATIPEGGRDVLGPDALASARLQGSRQLVSGGKQSFPDGTGWRIELPDDKAGPSKVQLVTPVTGEVKKGDKMLLTFRARCVPGSSADGKGRSRVVVEIKDPPNYPKLGQDEFTVGSEWETVFVPFPSDYDSRPDITLASFMPGGRKQTLEIAALRLIDYGPDFPMEKLPRPYLHYPGREADAPWRTEALERIEKIRTTSVAVEVVDATGHPVPGVKVDATLVRHQFGFGTAVKAKNLADPSERGERYRRVVSDNFSRIVFENDLKPFGREAAKSNAGNAFRDEWTAQSIRWAKEQGLSIRGHYLCWGPWEPWSEKLKDDPAALRKHVMDHLENNLSTYGGDITEWDAVNHPVGWTEPRATIDQAIAPEFYADVFKAARARVKSPLFVNEDQVFREGRQQDEYFTAIETLIQQGAKPDGIGNMAHFHSSFLPAPQEMWRVSDRFAKLVPNLEITEFDVVTNGDEQLQADWLRDCLIMAYSHPAYSGFMLWVFWEGAGWRPEAALWKSDWSEKPNAKVWRELVRGKWLSHAAGQTDAQGQFTARGHKGLYDITLSQDGKTRTLRQSFTDGGQKLKVVW